MRREPPTSSFPLLQKNVKVGQPGALACVRPRRLDCGPALPRLERRETWGTRKIHRSFVGRPSRFEGLRFLRMTLSMRGAPFGGWPRQSCSLCFRGWPVQASAWAGSLWTDCARAMRYSAKCSSRSNVSGYLAASNSSAAAWALGLARPCSHFSRVRSLVNSLRANTLREQWKGARA